MKVERSITIARPPADVFAYVSDVRNDPTWHTDVLEVRSSTDVVGMGTVFDVKVKPSMGVSEGTMTVSRFEPGTLIGFSGRMGKMAPTVTNVCEPDSVGTRFTRRVEMEPSGDDAPDGPVGEAHDREGQRGVPLQPQEGPRSRGVVGGLGQLCHRSRAIPPTWSGVLVHAPRQLACVRTLLAPSTDCYRLGPGGPDASGRGRSLLVGRARGEGRILLTSFLNRIRGVFTDKWAQRASALGLTYHPSSDPHDTRSQLRMPLFRRGGGGRVNDAMEGTWRDANVRLLSLAWHTAKTNQDEHWWLGLTPIDARTSPLHIGKVPPDDRSIDELGLERVTFELGDFNRQWLVYAADPRVAVSIVDQQMMQWLMTSHPQWDYELADGWIMVMREDLRASPSPYELEPVLEALLAFREHIPRVADSLFGSEDTT